MKKATEQLLITFSLLILGLFLNGCMKTVEIKPVAKDLPKIYEVKVYEKSVKFQTASNGCTHAEDFVAQIVEDAKNPQWQVVRLKPDWCKRKTFLANIKIELPVAGLSKEKLLNK